MRFVGRSNPRQGIHRYGRQGNLSGGRPPVGPWQSQEGTRAAVEGGSARFLASAKQYRICPGPWSRRQEKQESCFSLVQKGGSKRRSMRNWQSRALLPRQGKRKTRAVLVAQSHQGRGRRLGFRAGKALRAEAPKQSHSGEGSPLSKARDSLEIRYGELDGRRSQSAPGTRAPGRVRTRMGTPATTRGPGTQAVDGEKIETSAVDEKMIAIDVRGASRG